MPNILPQDFSIKPSYVCAATSTPSSAKQMMANSEQKSPPNSSFDQNNPFAEKIDLSGCRYHEDVFQRMLDEVKGSKQELAPLERFLQEDDPQIHVLSAQPKRDGFLTRRDCSCKLFGDDIVISDGEND